MKPFDLEAAMRGEPVVTRSGEVWKFGAHNPEAQGRHRLIGWVAGMTRSHQDNGRYDSSESEFDLFMAPRKVQMWTRWFKDVNGKVWALHAKSPDDPVLVIDPSTGQRWLDVARLSGEWEE
jgi:hypothetical protein